MGWAFYVIDGRPCGYAVEALCDAEYCFERIDRGLGWLCGEMPGGDEHGCGGYFCGEHEANHGCPVQAEQRPWSATTCEVCQGRRVAEDGQPCRYCKGTGWYEAAT